ncbi:thiamine pyrophosphate-dependent enzyme [Paenibacillus silvae]|uniref:thiamine pyrophosphate-dependent enzyme n=1 Tax=Paenibacillus silvae TaxID=1325358 RepID=UPI0011A64D5C|nr:MULTISPECIES: thiamine pyrophosphate-dependent enzyme [Paenibacillus]MCK6075216.1 phosphonopyruvate decarboxylase [Paenibacillus silvae]MCK6149603.1 phosphonopyruvate decarboxylase [Paenibacillus silvae]MCK6267901.1 phosphonopyruvate decarboxylase [Paenibacillus silvae]
MRKDEAIQLILDQFPIAYIVSTCGHITRDLYNKCDREEHFYMVGSMGMAAPVALGLALANEHQQIVILDGDGSFLMNLGAAAMIGQQQPRNLIHVVLDNGMHESTGGQRTIGMENMTTAVLSMGYKAGLKMDKHEDWQQLHHHEGPVLIHIKVDPRTEKVGKRVEWTPQQILSRFSKAIRGETCELSAN